MLGEIRKKIGDIDDQILDLLLQRSELVQQVGEWKKENVAKDQIFIKPYRETEIVRDMLKKAKGKYPDNTIINIWRNIISASVNSEQPLSICAFVNSNNETNYWLAREYFGNVCEIEKTQNADKVVDNVANGRHTIGVLSMDDTQKWWCDLPSDIKIFARIDNTFCIAKIDLKEDKGEHVLYITDKPDGGEVLDNFGEKNQKSLVCEVEKKTKTRHIVGKYSQFR